MKFLAKDLWWRCYVGHQLNTDTHNCCLEERKIDEPMSSGWENALQK